MTTWVALLRGVNLGKRQVKSADLKSAFEAMGFANVRTLLASGNVLFDAEKAPDRGKIEAALEKRFGFDIGTLLRPQTGLRRLVDSRPFLGLSEDTNTKLYVTFLAEPVAKTLPMPCEIEGDFKVVKLTDYEVFIVGYRLPTGRFGAGMEMVWKHFGKKQLWTSRNWNTVVKAAAG